MVEGLRRLLPMFTPSDGLRFGVSLVLALLLWGYVTTLQDPEESRPFPNVMVRVPELPPALVLRSPPPLVTVRYTGPESEIDDITVAEVGAELDVSEIDEAGAYRVPIRVDDIGGVRRERAEPREVSITVEREVSLPFALTIVPPDLEDATRRVGTVVPAATDVTVTGPESLVNRVDSVVLPIEIDNQSEDFEGTFVPQARDVEGNPVAEVAILPEAVTAVVPIVARGKTVAVIAQVVGEPAAGYEVVSREVEPQTVVVDGPQEALEGLITVTTAPIDLSGRQGSVFQRVGIEELPPGVQVLQPSGGGVDVVVQINQRGQVQPIPSQQVETMNLGPGLVARIEPPELSVVVMASDAQLANLDGPDLSVRVNLDGLGVGTHQVRPSVSVPANVQWLRTEPETVSVIITEPTDGATPSAATPPPDG